MASPTFGDPVDWPDQDLIGLSDEFGMAMVVEAYTAGVFPMPLEIAGRQEMGWFSPVDRGILPLDGLRVTRSLRKMTKRYEVTFDRAFDDVVRRCADPNREGAWIDQRIEAIYGGLHRRGIA
ncbi:MAG: leucyl/phenylalanyl-tRNA--protein transferase family protein, partial [Propionibacteriales bacterium]|nr:leucyl/phenylalanyl-tRNA--protein transferase family protein [Propionibacteriales bacterium]